VADLVGAWGLSVMNRIITCTGRKPEPAPAGKMWRGEFPRQHLGGGRIGKSAPAPYICLSASNGRVAEWLKALH
jgi:hypothetical protein